MKKILLLLTICLAYVYADAQTIDKKLLYGKWMLYSMSGDGQSISRDNMEQGVAGMVNQGRIKTPAMTAEDSLAEMARLKNQFRDLFKSYMIYHEDDTCIIFLGVDRDENGKLFEKKTTYVWSGDNKILLTQSQSDPETWVIESLTPDKLVTRLEDKADQKRILRMVFVR